MLRQKAQEDKPDIIAVVECLPKHCLTPLQKHELEITGYQLYWNGESSTQHRGICIYTRESLSVTQIEGPHINEYIESVWLSIRLNSCEEHALLGSIYRSPSSDTDNNDKLLNLITWAKNHNGKHLLLGDFNFPEIQWREGQGTTKKEQGQSSIEEKFIKKIEDCYLYQHVSIPTRIRGDQKPSCLDLCLTCDPEDVTMLEQEPPLGKSDHVCLRIHWNVGAKRHEFKRTSYNFNKGNYDRYRTLLRTSDWTQKGTETLENSWERFKSIVIGAADQSVPKKKSGSFTKPLWLDHKTIMLIKYRNRAWIKYLHTRNPAHYETYRKLRNRATAEARTARKQFEGTIAKSSVDNPKAFWRYVSSRSKTSKGVSDLINEEGKLATEPTDKAEALAISTGKCSLKRIHRHQKALARGRTRYC